MRANISPLAFAVDTAGDWNLSSAEVPVPSCGILVTGDQLACKSVRVILELVKNPA